MYRVYENAIQVLAAKRRLHGKNEGEYVACGRRFRNEAIIVFCVGRIWRRGFYNGWRTGEQSYKQLGYENPGIKV